MPATGLFGPYALTKENIDQYLTPGIGVYVLDSTSAGNFQVDYVGRADYDLPTRLSQHLNEGYHYFKYGYYDTAKAAFQKECEIYHDFKPPHNKIHPARPEGTLYPCPVADCDALD